jgi:CRISPR-associated protein Cmx8
LGAEACTAENVSFRDRARYQLLLHFWPLIAQIYCPYVLDAQKGERAFVGYAIAIPDVADVPRFLRAWEKMMHDRLPDKVAYRPQGAVIDIAVESALDLAGRLHQSIATLEGEKGTRPAILGIEVLHMNKEGNNVRLLSSDRLDPTFGQLREYEQIKRACWDVVFRRQRLLNLIKNRPWYFGFDGLAATLPYKSQFFGSARFRHDAFSHFEQLRKEMNDQEHEAASGSPSREAQDELSVAVYRLARSYVRRKVESKYRVAWNDRFRNPEGLTPEERQARSKYYEHSEKVASDAFLAVRGRTGADFAEYFCASLCSVPQAISEANFQRIGRALRDKESQAELRILTLLALSAAAYTSLDKKSESRPAADSNS